MNLIDEKIKEQNANILENKKHFLNTDKGVVRFAKKSSEYDEYYKRILDGLKESFTMDLSVHIPKLKAIGSELFEVAKSLGHSFIIACVEVKIKKTEIFFNLMRQSHT